VTAGDNHSRVGPASEETVTLLLELRRQLGATGAALRLWATLLSGRAAALTSEAGYGTDEVGDDVGELVAALVAPDPSDSGLVTAALPEKAVPGERVLRACREVAATAETVWNEAVEATDRPSRLGRAERCTRVAQDARRRAGQARRYVELMGDLAAEEMARTRSGGAPRAGTVASDLELDRLTDAFLKRSREHE
jgi:hypothetical protein